MIKDLRKTSIVCTLGPATEDRIEELFRAGMNVARINFSHGGREENKSKVEKFKEVRSRLGIPAALMLDTQGPEIRTGKLEEAFPDGVEIFDGQEFVLKNNGILTNQGQASVSYSELYQDLNPGNRILIDDGNIELEVQYIDNGEIHCKVIDGGILKSRKSVNVPGIYLNNPTLSQKDIDDLRYAAEEEFEFVAASFIRNKDDVLTIRRVLDDHGGNDVEIIAKIENQQSLENIDEILESSDGIMIARGDLAVEIPFVEVPIWQKELISKSNKMGKPVIVATQMLESMINNPTPTRAEASDVANAVYDKASAVMLSGETAVGKYPIKCVETMSNICKKVESKLNYWGRIRNLPITRSDLETDAVVMVVNTAKELNADLIIAYTNSGRSVKKLAGFGPTSPIFAITDNWKTYNKLALAWNVVPMFIEKEEIIDNMIEKAIYRMKENNIVNEGDLVILTGGKDYLNGVSQSKRIGGVTII